MPLSYVLLSGSPHDAVSICLVYICSRMYADYTYVQTDAWVSIFISLCVMEKLDFDDCNAICNNCNFQYRDIISSVFCAQFWPQNIARNCYYMFIIQFFDMLQKFVSGCFITGFIHPMVQLSACKV